MWPGASNHFVCPVVHGFLVIDLFSKSSNERTWCPDDPRIVLLDKHLVEQRHEPVLEFAIVVVGYDQVPDAIHTSLTKVRSVHIEVCEICLAEAFNEVLLNSSRRRDKCRYVFVFHEV